MLPLAMLSNDHRSPPLSCHITPKHHDADLPAFYQTVTFALIPPNTTLPLKINDPSTEGINEQLDDRLTESEGY